MKLSDKLNNKVSELIVSVTNFSDKVSTLASESIDDLSKITEEGNKVTEDISKDTEKIIKKFNKIKTFCQNFAEDAKEISEEIEKTSARLDSETPTDASDKDKKFAEKLSRKFNMLHKRFSEIAKSMNDITTEAKAVVNMKPENVVKANKNETSTPTTSTVNGEGAPADGAGVTTQPGEVTSDPKSVVNFSVSNYYNFASATLKNTFAEIKDKAEDAKDVVKDISDQVTLEPEPKPAEGKEPVPPTTTSKPKEVTPAPAEPKETPKDDKGNKEIKNMSEEEVTALAKEVESFGQEIIMNNDKEKAEELDKKLNDLESKAPGKGEEVISKLENFSEHFKIFSDFTANKATDIFDRIKEFSTNACEGAIKKSVDVKDLGSKAEELEKNQPGAGELLTSVIECFGKIIDAVKVPVAADAPIKPKFCAKNFCGDIEKFVDDIKVEDKRFGRDLKTKCFSLMNSIEDGDSEAIKKNASELATSLDKSEDESIKSFGEKLVKFAEELAADEAEKAKAEKPASEGAAAPEQIQKADQELNKVIDKISENGEQLKPEIAAFAKKLCFAYKSMKCFTEEDLTKKLECVETLKKDFDENKKVEKPAEPAPAATPKKPESILVEEPQMNPTELPSDASLKNFSIVSDVNDPLGHLASLDIH